MKTKKAKKDMDMDLGDVSPGLLRAHPLNRNFPQEGQEWEEFCESVRRPGRIFSRLLVRRVDDDLEILAGHRRAAAAKAVGLETVPVEIFDGMTDEDALTLVLNENLQRAEMCPLDEALIVRALAEEYGMGPQEIGERISRGHEWVRLRQGIFDLGPEVMEAVRVSRDDPRHLSLGAVAELLAVPEALREEAVQMVLHPDLEEGALNAAQARQVLRACLVEPWRAKMEWEGRKDAAAAEVRKALKEAMGKRKDVPAVVAMSYEDGDGARARGHVRWDAEVADFERGDAAPAGLRWVDVAARHGLAVRVFRDETAMVDAGLLRQAERAWADDERPAWVIEPGSVQRPVPGAGGAEPVTPDPDGDREDEEEAEAGEWTQGEMTGRMWIDSQALRRVAMWSVSDSQEVDRFDGLPEWAVEICERLGVEDGRRIVGDACLWVKQLGSEGAER
jgi:ParB/RepB/Spo0J family partition protein